MESASYVPKDLNEYEERIFLGLTNRQIVWGGIAMASGVSFYLVTSFVLGLPSDLCMYGTVGIAFVLFWMGWRKWQNVRPYTDKMKAWLRMKTVKQRVLYTNNVMWFDKDIINGGGTNVRTQSKKGRKIDKEHCQERRKPTKQNK